MSEKVSRSLSYDEDFSIIVGKRPNQKTFGSSSRILLSAFSGIFNRMFFESGKEVELPEDKLRAFEIMIGCLLTGEIRPETAQDAIDVYKLVDRYQVIQVGRRCVDYLLENMSTEDVIQIYEMANEFSEHVLRIKSFVYICENATGVLKANSFINSKFSTVQAIVSKDCINVSSEVDVYDAVSRWLNEECGRKGSELNADETIKKLLSEIRFLTMMTIAEFHECRAKTQLLSDQESVSILRKIVSSNAVKLPEICNRSETKRHYQSDVQRILSSACVRKSGKFEGKSVKIQQKSKLFSSDTCIYGVSVCMDCYNYYTDLWNAIFELTIKNITKGTEKTNRFERSVHSEDDKFTFMIDEPILVMEGEECEISLSGEFDTYCKIYICGKDCQLEEFFASDSDTHFHKIFVYRM